LPFLVNNVDQRVGRIVREADALHVAASLLPSRGGLA